MCRPEIKKPGCTCNAPDCVECKIGQDPMIGIGEYDESDPGEQYVKEPGRKGGRRVLRPGEYYDCGALQPAGYMSVRRAAGAAELYEIVIDVPPMERGKEYPDHKAEDADDPVLETGFKTVEAAAKRAWELHAQLKPINRPWERYRNHLRKPQDIPSPPIDTGGAGGDNK